LFTIPQNGTPRKLVDVSRLGGWNAKVSLREGLGKAYAAFLTDAVRGQPNSD
jgi:hypothetical protein